MMNHKCGIFELVILGGMRIMEFRAEHYLTLVNFLATNLVASQCSSKHRVFSSRHRIGTLAAGGLHTVLYNWAF